MSPEAKAEGVRIATDVLYWSLFSGPCDMRSGELRQHIVALFGAEIDAELAKRFSSDTPTVPVTPP